MPTGWRTLLEAFVVIERLRKSSRLDLACMATLLLLRAVWASGHEHEPPATEDEVRDAALQYVRKISGYTKPSQANDEVFARAVDEVADATRRLVDGLVTTASPRDREVEAERRKARAAERFATA